MSNISVGKSGDNDHNTIHFKLDEKTGKGTEGLSFQSKSANKQKNINFSPSPAKNYLEPELFYNETKFEIDTFESIVAKQSQEVIKQSKHIKSNSINKASDNKEEFTRQTKLSQSMKGKSFNFDSRFETLKGQMPNFIANYDDLLGVINCNKNSSEGNSFSETAESIRRSVGTKASNVFSKTSENTTTSIFSLAKNSSNEIAPNTVKNKHREIDSFITSQKKKLIETETNKESEAKEKMMKTLTNTEDIKDFYEYTEECMKRIAKLRLSTNEEIEHLRIDLPKNLENEMKYGNKRLAIFDLDETLVHCEIKKPQKAQIQIQVKMPSGTTTNVSIKLI